MISENEEGSRSSNAKKYLNKGGRDDNNAPGIPTSHMYTLCRSMKTLWCVCDAYEEISVILGHIV